MALFADAIIRINADASKATSEMKKIDGAASVFTGTLGKLVGVLSGLISTTAITVALQKAISMFSEFEFSMRNVLARTGATAEEFQKLTEYAQLLGAETIYQGREVAAAMNLMAGAGLSTKEIMESLGGVLNFAAATQETLANSTNLVISTLRSFNMDASESDRVADSMTKTITSSRASVEKLTASLKYAGSASEIANQRMNTMLTALAKMYDAGIDGSIAGTALRNIFANLADPTAKAAKMIERLGLAIEDVNPSSNDFLEIIEKLRKALEKTNIDPLVAAMQIFGKRAGPPMLTLLNATNEELLNFRKSLDLSTGSAKRMADLQLDTVHGVWELFRSAIEGVSIKLGEALAPAIKEILILSSDLVLRLKDVIDTLLDLSDDITDFWNTFKYLTLLTTFIDILYQYEVAIYGADAALKQFLETEKSYANFKEQQDLTKFRESLKGYTKEQIKSLEEQIEKSNKYNKSSIENLEEQKKGIQGNITDIQNRIDKIKEDIDWNNKLLEVLRKIRAYVIESEIEKNEEIAKLREKQRMNELKSFEQEEKERIEITTQTIEDLKEAYEEDTQNMKGFTDEKLALLYKYYDLAKIAIENEMQGEELYVERVLELHKWLAEELTKIDNEQNRATEKSFTSWEYFMRDAMDVSQGVSDAFIGSFNNIANSLGAVIRGAKTWGETMKRVGEQIIDTLTAVIAKFVIASILQAALSAGTGGGGGMGMFFMSMFSMDEGGWFTKSGYKMPLTDFQGHFNVNVLPGELMIPPKKIPEFVGSIYNAGAYSAITSSQSTIGDINFYVTANDYDDFIDKVKIHSKEITAIFKKDFYLRG